MTVHGWYTKKTHGNVFSAGFPDYYARHKLYGPRWIETKTDIGQLTAAQKIVFPDLIKAGDGIWILRDERDYQLLFKPHNFLAYFSKLPAFIKVK